MLKKTEFQKYYNFVLMLVLIGMPLLFLCSFVLISFIYNNLLVHYFNNHGFKLCRVEGVSYIILFFVPVFMEMDMLDRLAKRCLRGHNNNSFESEVKTFDELVAKASDGASEHGTPYVLTKLLSRDTIMYSIFFGLIIFALINTYVSC